MSQTLAAPDISPDVLTDGHWEAVRGIQRWVGDPGSEPRQTASTPFDQLIACPTCRARVDQSCRTAAGHTTTPHGNRLIQRCCPCGAKVAGRRRLCDPCHAEAKRQSNRIWRQRRQAA